MSYVYVDGPRGLGDAIYQRPFVKALCQRSQVWLATSWPEVFSDLPVHLVCPHSELRTQALNEQRNFDRYVRPPSGVPVLRIGGGADFRHGNISRAIERAIPLNGFPFEMDLPDLGHGPIRTTKPIAVVRPATVRREWPNEARNPRPEYVDWIAQQLMDTHLVVAVAHLAGRQEWALSMPPHHTDCTGGQLSTRQMLALVRDADIVVGGVGWIVPAAIALKTRAFVVLGGNLGHNRPDLITDDRMDLSRIGFAWPDAPCLRCEDPRHLCAKTISDLEAQWSTFLAR